ncbi:hypothetical protein [Oceanobacillus polygoni]|uniref:Peptidyl-prolyl cis-trans isomerase n=1 Tax=Oceanobacillus polygoni TaxID=1235259 RepID=A0A9X0YVE3_9BACI|nr:hypothetical protein [Oceanobacillus polygoni]MBP2077894.1 hypothetical protein [Oceanobacillus polygoni]
MIVPIIGNVFYSITLDPTVWIFDDRKILLNEAFSDQGSNSEEVNDLELASQRFNREVFDVKMNRPPVNRSISKREGETILKNSYVMPLHDFIKNAEIKSDATHATLVSDEDETEISIADLENGYFLFAIDGKPIKENGPVHFFYRDGSNKDNPITTINKIIIH